MYSENETRSVTSNFCGTTNDFIFPDGLLDLPNAEAELRLECGGLAAGAAEQQA